MHESSGQADATDRSLDGILAFVSYSDLEPVSKQLTIIVGLTVVGFMAFGLTLSFYRNILFEVTLENIQEENLKLRRNNAGRLADLEYYRSAQYKDKYAKENLGKVRPGEKAIIIKEEIPEPVYDAQGNTTATDRQEWAFEEVLRQTPVLEHWRLFLFHREKIEGLKQSL